MQRLLLLLTALLLLLSGRPASAQGVYRFDGTVVDANTQRPLAAEVTVFGAEPAPMSHLFTSVNGVFSVQSEAAGPYKLVVGAPAYQTQEVAQTAAGPSTTFTVRLVPMPVGSKMPLNSLRFKQSKAELLPESYGELLRLVAALNANPTLEIRLNGHTDNQGDPAKNQILSEQRVQAVIAYLVRRGIAVGRLSGQGFGDTQPVAPNDKEATRALNRRVELEIMKL